MSAIQDDNKHGDDLKLDKPPSELPDKSMSAGSFGELPVTSVIEADPYDPSTRIIFYTIFDAPKPPDYKSKKADRSR